MNLTDMKNTLGNLLPAFLKGLGCYGIFETAKLAVECSNKVIDEYEDWPSQTKEYLKAYGPAIISGIITGCCFLGSEHVHIRKESEIAIAAAYLAKFNQDYRNKTKELYGEETDQRIYQEVCKDQIVDTPPPSYLKRWSEEDGSFTIYEPITKQYFNATRAQVEWAKYEINRRLSTEQKYTLNEALRLFPGTDCKRAPGNTLGWYLDDSYLDYVYFNASFFGRPWMELILTPTITEEGEIFVLTFSEEPMMECCWDVDVVKDSQDVHAI